MLQKGFIPIIALIIFGLIISVGFIASKNQKTQLIIETSTSQKTASPSAIIPSSSPTPFVSPSTTPSPSTSNTSISTPNPCRLGEPTPVTLDPSVHLDSVSPSSGKAGDTIILKGSGFGKSSFYFPDPTKFLGMVSFYGSLCGYNSGGAPPAEEGEGWWSDNTIKVRVPGVSSGKFNLEVMSSDGKRSNRVDFQVSE